MTSHLSRLDLSLQALLRRRPLAALGTLAPDGAPFVSMVPWAWSSASMHCVLHVSALAAHTQHLRRDPRVCLMVMEQERDSSDGTPPQAAERVSIDARASWLAADDPLKIACRSAYLARFPDAEPITQLPDFAFVALQPLAVRHVAGFGAARSIEPAQLAALLA